MLGRSLWSIAIVDLFDDMHRNSGLTDHEKQAHGGRLVLLARLLPALKTLNEHIDLLDPGPLDGHALVLKDAPDDVLSNGNGICVFKAESDAQELIRLWLHQDTEHVVEGQGPQPKADQFMVRQVRVSKEHGVEFL